MAYHRAKDKPQSNRTLAEILPRSNARIYDQDLLGAGIPVLHSGLSELAFGLATDVTVDAEADSDDPNAVHTILDFLEDDSVSIDEMAHDYIKNYSPEEIVLDTPSTQADYDLRVGEIERKILTSNSDNPLSTISRDVLVRLPHLPYLAALRGLIDWPANGVPVFTGTEADMEEKVLPVLGRLPTGGPYQSHVNHVFQEAAQNRGLIRQASLVQKVTAKVVATSNTSADMDSITAFYSAVGDDEDDEEMFLQDGSTDFIEENAGFGNTDIRAVDLANTKIAAYIAGRDMTTKETITALQREGMSAPRIDKIIRLVAAHKTVNKQSA